MAGTTGPGPHLLVGSHIETQNEAGWLDGALGVMAGVALARAGLPVDVCAFADEEGHFEGGFLGSRSIIGELTEDEIDRSRNRTDGTPLRDALRAAGLAGKPRMRLEPGRHKGFFEMHIEQGTQLEQCRPAHRRGHRHRRDLAVAHHRRGQAGPRRRHDDGGAAGRRPDGGAAAGGDRRRVPACRRGAQHLDHRPHRARPRRAQHHPRHAPTCCSSSATSPCRCWSAWRRRLRALVRESNRRERCTVDAGGGVARPSRRCAIRR